MFGDAWLNPLVFTFGTWDDTVVFKDNYLDVDGCVNECYSRVGVEMTNQVINITNAEYGIWNDLLDPCSDGVDDMLPGYTIIRDSHFFGSWDEALFAYLYLSSWDDMIITNTTWEKTGYMDMETRPFGDFHAAANCDPSTRS